MAKLTKRQQAFAGKVDTTKLYAFDEGYFVRDVDGEATEEDQLRLELPRHALHASRQG